MSATTVSPAATHTATRTRKAPPQPGPDVDANVVMMRQAMDMTSALRPGDQVTITYRDGVLQAQKQGISKYDAATATSSGIFGRVFGGGSTAVNATVGTDPTLISLTAFSTAFSAFSAVPTIPQTISQFFSDNFFSFFPYIAPIPDAVKLASTWKLSNAQIKRANDPHTKGLKAHAKYGNLLGLALDGGKLLWDVAILGAVIGCNFAIPALAWTTIPMALKLAFAGHVLAGACHGVGMAVNVSNPQNGPNFRARLASFVRTQGASAMYRRVVQGEEPLFDNQAPPAPPSVPTQAPSNQAPPVDGSGPAPQPV